MEMNEWYWCSIGFYPEDVAQGKCRKFNRNAFGCSRCKDFKLMSTEEIIRLSLRTTSEKISDKPETLLSDTLLDYQVIENGTTPTTN